MKQKKQVGLLHVSQFLSLLIVIPDFCREKNQPREIILNIPLILTSANLKRQLCVCHSANRKMLQTVPCAEVILCIDAWQLTPDTRQLTPDTQTAASDEVVLMLTPDILFVVGQKEDTQLQVCRACSLLHLSSFWIH